MFKKEYVNKETLSYFDGDQLATDVFISKYALRDKEGNYYESTPKDMHDRLADEFARIEAKYPNGLSKEEIFKLIDNFKYIVPQGSPMAGIGNNYQTTTLSNCYVIENPHDSYAGIFKTEQEMVQLMKRRGGVGFSIHSLRPKDVPTGSVAEKSSGVVLFSERYSNGTREVAQDGRRGALMLSCSIEHPDVLDFIDAKLDLSKITGANISVMITDKFMEAVINNEDYEVSFNSDKGNFKSKLNAKKVWDKIIHNAWASAEPGVLFWDTILRESPVNVYGEEWKETSTNPCVSADTKILTSMGYINIESCVGHEVDVWNGEEFSKVTPKVTGKTDKWYIIKFSDGSELKCTPYHEFYIDGGESAVEAQDLKVGNKLQKHNFPVIDGEINENLYTKGFYCGDGSNKRGEAIIDLYGNKKELVEYLSYRAASGTNVKRLYLGRDFELNKEFVPLQDYSISSKLTYLAGLIDSDGSLNDKESGSLNISSVNKEFLSNIKYLLNTLGANGTISLMKRAKMRKLPDGKGGLKEYQTKDSYRLIISATNVKKLVDIGLKTYRVNLIANPNRDTSRYIKVTDIQIVDVNNELTYCFTEPKKHKGIFNGVLTGQCAEIPLCPYDSCRLLAMNLYSYVDKPFEGKNHSKFNFDLFKSHAKIAQRLMDDIVDLEIEKIEYILDIIQKSSDPEEIKSVEYNVWSKILDKTIKGRRTGLGITGLGDAIAALGLTYGTQEATEVSEQIIKTLSVESYKSSIELAKERGSFPIFDIDIDEESDFMKRMLSVLKENEEYEALLDYETYGRRNIANLTIAPTGSVSTLTQTTSGVEPAFAVFYKRRRKTNDKSKATFTDSVGDLWEEYNVFHHKFIEWYDKNWYKTDPHLFDIDYKKPLELYSDEELNILVSKSPYNKATSNDVNWVEKVRMQGNIQKFIDHSISVTVNVPNDTPKSIVEEIYMMGWKSGCKGTTIYRDGCRSGVLVSTAITEKETEFEYIDAIKRPKTIECDIYHKVGAGEKWMIIVGLYENKPYEIFALSDLENSVFPHKIEKGKITKVKSKQYRLEGEYLGKQYIVDNVMDYMLDSEKNDTRKYSIKLRHRIKPKFIAEQIDKFASISGFDKVIGRVLKLYATGERTKDTCPVCTSDLTYQDGCVKCNSCGFSLCG